MRKLSRSERMKLVEAALGTRPVDLLIKNIKLVNVFTEEIYPAEIAIYGGYIAHVEADPDKVSRENNAAIEAKQVFDGQGMYVIPGLIDTHVHIESSMMTPANFAQVTIPNGTTTVITDPHEIGNVLGKAGVEYMLQAGRNLPMNQYVLVPSCVPSVPGFETSGAVFSPEDIAEMLQWEGVIGVAEVMDFPGVITNSPRMSQILAQAIEQNGYIQGHSPALSGRALSAYLCAGPTSDHEVSLGTEAREKLRAGMTVDARESSITHNLHQIIPALKGLGLPPNLTFCTDDREPEDLLYQGQLNHVVRRAIEEGLDPVQAIKVATFQAAQSIGLDHLGAVAPGYAADLVLLPSLKEMKPEYVFFAGKLVAKQGRLVEPIQTRQYALETKNTVNIQKLTADDFVIKTPIANGSIDVRVISYRTQTNIFSEFVTERLPVTNGILDISDCPGLNYVAVFNRHGNNNRALGVLRNFGLTCGAIASTVSHDCHNLTVVASNAEDAALAAMALVDCGGGIACVQNGEVLDVLELPIAGLMSPLPAKELTMKTAHLKNTLRNMGIPGDNPLLRIATLTLAVIPKAKITDMGLVSVNEQRFVPLFPQEKIDTSSPRR